MSKTQQIAREKTLYRYQSAVEQGNFAQVADMLAQAENDPVLEQMILELNEVLMMSETAVTPILPTPPPASKTKHYRPNWQRLRGALSYKTVIGLALTIILIFIFSSTFFLQRSMNTGIGDRELPPDVAIAIEDSYALDAPSASIPSYSLLSRSNDTNSTNIVASQPTALAMITATPAVILPNETPETISQTEPQPRIMVRRFIVRNGAVQASVEDTLAVKQAIEDRVAQMASDGAFVISSNESGQRNDLPTINIAIRVPVAQFDEMMDWLAAQVAAGTTATRSETADDVTAEYVDLAARIQSLQAARDRLLELMQNAETTEELLLAEQQLTQRETEIEGLQGRLQYLSQSAQLSRIDITLTPYILSQPPDTSWRPAETTRRAYDALLISGRSLLNFLIYFVIAILPWLIGVGLLLTLIYRFIWRPLRARQQ